jgi:aminomethyltransferase
VQGPGSRDLLGKLTDADLSSLRYFRFLPERAEVAGVPAWVLRTGFSGELGFELIPDRDRAVELWRALGEAGVRPFGLDAVELLRVEAGLVIVALDYEPGSTSPYDVGLDRCIVLDEGSGLVGLDALRTTSAAPPRRFKTVMVQGGQVPEYGAEVYRGDELVGTLTSPVDSPRFGVIGLAVLDSEHAHNGNVLEVAVGEDGAGRAKGTVTDLSIHDPDKRKPRS